MKRKEENQQQRNASEQISPETVVGHFCLPARRPVVWPEYPGAKTKMYPVSLKRSNGGIRIT